MVIKDGDYIDSVTPAIVDRDEYSEMMRNISSITQDVLNYVNGYINHKNGFSTLPYFDEILGLT